MQDNTLAAGWIGTDISNFKVTPERETYTPGTDVVLEGKLTIHGWPDWFNGGDQTISILSGEAVIGTARTGPDGVFRIPVRLPFTEGTYAYYARYYGSGFPAGWDPCSSSTIAITVSGAQPPQVFTCQYCGQTFPTNEALLAHIQSAHPEQPVFTCSICGLKFSTQQALDDHIASAHPGQDRLKQWIPVIVGVTAAVGVVAVIIYIVRK